MKTGDIIEWRSNSIVGRSIRFFSKQDVNHTSIVLNLDQYVPNHSKFILEANAGRFELNPLSTVLEKYSGSAYWLALKPEWDDKRIGLGAWALEKVGTPYDFGSLFKNMFGRVTADARKMFCSEANFLDLVSNGIVPAGKAPRPGEWEQFKIYLKRIQIL